MNYLLAIIYGTLTECKDEMNSLKSAWISHGIPGTQQRSIPLSEMKLRHKNDCASL